MNVTRRHLVATGALALGGVALMRSSAAVAQFADEAGVAKAVEALRQATLDEQGAARGAVPRTAGLWPLGWPGRDQGAVHRGCHDPEGDPEGAHPVGPRIAVVGANAIARHNWTSESELDGKATTTKIKVMQVWLKDGGAGSPWPGRRPGRRSRRNQAEVARFHNHARRGVSGRGSR